MVAYGIVMRRPAYFPVLAATAAALFCGLAVAVETNRLAGFDEAIRTELHSLSSPLLTLLAEKATWLGSLSVLALFGVVAVAVLVHARRRDGALFLTVTMVGALALENGLKFLVQRVRPPPFFGSEPVTYSFPSGHALFSLCFYDGLAERARVAPRGRAERRSRARAIRYGASWKREDTRDSAARQPARGYLTARSLPIASGRPAGVARSRIHR